MGKVASFDIETFCPAEELTEEDLLYLRCRKEYVSEEDFHRDLSTNPYISFLISFSLFLIEEGRAYVFYLGEEDEEKVSTVRAGEETIEEVYVSVSMERGLFSAERILLQLLWKQLEGIDKLITFHGKDFDMEFVKIRTFIHGIRVGAFYRYFHPKGINHIDLKEIFKVGRSNYSLNFISKKMNLPVDKGGMDGSKIREVFLRGEYGKVAEYNLSDAVLTGLLYKRVRDYLYMDSVMDFLKSLGFSEGKDLIEYAIENNLLSVREASVLIDLCKGKIETGPSDKQVVYLRDLINTHRPELREVCALLSQETIHKIIKSLWEEEIT